jgi:peptide-methionine (S)-S-oxide reductase
MNLLRAAAMAALASLSITPAAQAAALKTAIFAGGCFWSTEKAMESLPGVTNAVSGYAGGALKNPTYENHRGHLEAVKVTYDPARISYEKLVDGFFHHIDPTDAGGQICDRGPSYTTAVFVADPAETATAQAVKAQVARTLGKPVATRILTGGKFWPAEAYHQDYARKNPASYNAYKVGCGRDRALKAVWGSAYP